MWLKIAWDVVDQSTIKKCFVKCGFIDTAVETVNDLVAPISGMEKLWGQWCSMGRLCKLQQ